MWRAVPPRAFDQSSILTEAFVQEMETPFSFVFTGFFSLHLTLAQSLANVEHELNYS